MPPSIVVVVCRKIYLEACKIHYTIRNQQCQVQLFAENITWQHVKYDTKRLPLMLLFEPPFPYVPLLQLPFSLSTLLNNVGQNYQESDQASNSYHLLPEKGKCVLALEFRSNKRNTSNKYMCVCQNLKHLNFPIHVGIPFFYDEESF